MISVPYLTQAHPGAFPKASWWENPHGQGSELWLLQVVAKVLTSQRLSPFMIKMRTVPYTVV